ncbi:MAG: hypothetical protein KAT48_13845 [Bacteroidales bacterium]|nr:hypothetical protein [Bacteroidales bacterium]
MKKITYILIGIVSLFVYKESTAQEATAEVNRSSILIGDQINLTLKLAVPASATIVWPDIRDTIIREIEVVTRTKIDTITNEKEEFITYIQTLTITSFDSGYFAVPPFIFLYKTIDEAEYQAIETGALLLEVQTIEVDTSKDIIDIKPPIHVPVSFQEIWPWLVLGLLGLLFMLGIIYFIKKRKKSEPIIQIRKKPVLPPHQIALDALESLKRKKLWQSGKIKSYHTELTDIVRRYIENRFDIQAIEMVTFEILVAMQRTVATDEAKEKLKEMLELADLVKFAKEKPLPDDEEKSMKYAINFINDTIHLIEEVKIPEVKEHV